MQVALGCETHPGGETVFQGVVPRILLKRPVLVSFIRLGRIEQRAPGSSGGTRRALCAALVGIVLFASAAHGASHPETRLTAETSCREIRAALSALAKAEREQALALHLMAGGKPTPVVEARLTELQVRTSALRAILRKVRDNGPADDPQVQRCVALGFRSLFEADTLSNEIEQVVIASGGPLTAPLRAGESNWAKFPGETLPRPPAPAAAPSRVAPR